MRKSCNRKPNINGIYNEKPHYKSDQSLAFPVRSRSKRKNSSEIFIFTLLCGASKGFMETFKVFIKPFEALQKSVKIKIKLIFVLIQLSEIRGAERNKIKPSPRFSKKAKKTLLNFRIYFIDGIEIYVCENQTQTIKQDQLVFHHKPK